MEHGGYFRFPAIHGQTIVFVSEDDLWTVPVDGGIPCRLTSGMGSTRTPAISPDGKWIAFSGTEEGPPEVFVMPFAGGQPRRITFVGEMCTVIGWTPSGQIAFTNALRQPFWGMMRVFAVSPTGGQPQELPAGPASFISFGPDGASVIARPSVEAAYWKRYRGGTTGDLWIDPKGNGDWRRLIQVKGNASRP